MPGHEVAVEGMEWGKSVGYCLDVDISCRPCIRLDPGNDYIVYIGNVIWHIFPDTEFFRMLYE